MIKDFLVNRRGFMKKKSILWVIVVLLIILSLAIGSNRQFSFFGLFQGHHESWELFWESRLPRTLAIILASSAISLSGLLMQTISQNPYAAPSTTGTTEAAQLGILSSLFFFGKATLFQKMSFAFISSLLFTSLFIQVIRRLKFKEKWVLPLVGLIYSGIIGSFAEMIAFRFNLIQSMTSWSQGSFSMIQRHQYEWLFLLVIVLLGVWLYSNTFSVRITLSDNGDSCFSTGFSNFSYYHDNGWCTSFLRRYRTEFSSSVCWRFLQKDPKFSCSGWYDISIGL